MPLPQSQALKLPPTTNDEGLRVAPSFSAAFLSACAVYTLRLASADTVDHADREPHAARLVFTRAAGKIFQVEGIPATEMPRRRKISVVHTYFLSNIALPVYLSAYAETGGRTGLKKQRTNRDGRK